MSMSQWAYRIQNPYSKQYKDRHNKPDCNVGELLTALQPPLGETKLSIHITSMDTAA